MLRELASKPGLTRAHLLITDRPTTSVPTTEQRMTRGGPSDRLDRSALGLDPEVVSSKLTTVALRNMGPQQKVTAGHYTLTFTTSSQDTAATA